MEINQSEFIISAVRPEQYPSDNRVEVAFVGRSNVGKSSLINNLTNRRKLAKTSSTPGKTRLINFFLINNDIYFVDLPGYGYAKVSKDEKAKWGNIVETYLMKRPQLSRVLLLVDSRREPTEDDILMYNWIKHYGYEVIIIATKSDKITKNEMAKSDKIIRKTLKLPNEQKIIYYSSLKRTGREEVLDVIFNNN